MEPFFLECIDVEFMYVPLLYSSKDETSVVPFVSAISTSPKVKSLIRMFNIGESPVYL